MYLASVEDNDTIVRASDVSWRSIRFTMVVLKSKTMLAVALAVVALVCMVVFPATLVRNKVKSKDSLNVKMNGSKPTLAPFSSLQEEHGDEHIDEVNADNANNGGDLTNVELSDSPSTVPSTIPSDAPSAFPSSVPTLLLVAATPVPSIRHHTHDLPHAHNHKESKKKAILDLFGFPDDAPMPGSNAPSDYPSIIPMPWVTPGPTYTEQVLAVEGAMRHRRKVRALRDGSIEPDESSA